MMKSTSATRPAVLAARDGAQERRWAVYSSSPSLYFDISRAGHVPGQKEEAPLEEEEGGGALQVLRVQLPRHSGEKVPPLPPSVPPCPGLAGDVRASVEAEQRQQ